MAATSPASTFEMRPARARRVTDPTQTPSLGRIGGQAYSTDFLQRGVFRVGVCDRWDVGGALGLLRSDRVALAKSQTPLSGSAPGLRSALRRGEDGPVETRGRGR